jgi:hypothetical protein
MACPLNGVIGSLAVPSLFGLHNAFFRLHVGHPIGHKLTAPGALDVGAVSKQELLVHQLPYGRAIVLPAGRYRQPEKNPTFQWVRDSHPPTV